MNSKIKNKFFLVFAFLLLLFALNTEKVFAQGNSVSSIVEQFYSWAVGAAAGIVSIAFLIGAVGYIISGGEANLKADSKDRMISAILGGLLLTTSYLILETINPQLVSLGQHEPSFNPIVLDLKLKTAKIGVTFFTKNCNEPTVQDLTTTSSVDSIKSRNFKNFEIVNNDASKEYFGVILHKDHLLSGAGICGEIVTQAGCHPMDDALSVDVFPINHTPATSGSGVVFFSEPQGYASGANAGWRDIKDKEITAPKYTVNSNEIQFLYTGVDRTKTYQDTHKTFQASPGSIDILGDYLVRVNSTITELDKSTGDNIIKSFCQTFDSRRLDDKKVPNLINTEPIVASGKIISTIDIIPTIEY